MFNSVVIPLLQGEFICASKDPDAFSWLSKEANMHAVNDYLSHINRNLSSTSNRQAFYCSWKSLHQDERIEAKRVFTQIKQIIRPLMQFLSLCMEVEKKDSIPSPGDIMDYASYLKIISDSPYLIESLRVFSTLGKDFSVTDASVKGIFDKVVQQIEKNGYLILINREKSIYRFTGKLDYFYEVNDFLIENEKIDVNIPEEKPGDLF